jgi:hypothetical protein
MRMAQDVRERRSPLDARELRDRKVDVLRSIRPLSEDDIVRQTRRAPVHQRPEQRRSRSVLCGRGRRGPGPPDRETLGVSGSPGGLLIGERW